MTNDPGDLIKHERKRLGLTQTRLCELLGMSRGCLSRIECASESPAPASASGWGLGLADLGDFNIRRRGRLGDALQCQPRHVHPH